MRSAELARTLEGMLGALDAARNESETALARQREFVADASHELRTPLTAVLANLELLADELDGEQAESAKSALRSTRRMRRLVGDLLLLARADAQRTRPLEPTDLAEVLTDAAGELGAVAESHFLTLDPSPAVVLGNRDDLHRLALNLLDNALNHTPPGTSVNASTGVIDGVPTLIVEDDGPGIPAGDAPARVRSVRAGGRRQRRRRSRDRPRAGNRSGGRERPRRDGHADDAGPRDRDTVRDRVPAAAEPESRRRRAPGSDFDDDRQHHRATAESVVDERREVVVKLLPEQVDLANPV